MVEEWKNGPGLKRIFEKSGFFGFPKTGHGNLGLCTLVKSFGMSPIKNTNIQLIFLPLSGSAKAGKLLLLDRNQSIALPKFSLGLHCKGVSEGVCSQDNVEKVKRAIS